MKKLSNSIEDKHDPVNMCRGSIKKVSLILLAAWACLSFQQAFGQTTPSKEKVPDWALPGSATHRQVPPPVDFHRATRTALIPIGIFEGQSDVGGALVRGSSSYDSSTNSYSIISAGYNVWYTRDEFRYLWKKMSGDISLAADISFPDTAGYDDRKAILVIRQSLDDDSKEVMVALHGGGLVHLAWRAEQDADMKEMRLDTRVGMIDGKDPEDSVMAHARRIGIEKQGDLFSIYISMEGEPMHFAGSPVRLQFHSPFYVGIGFCSHQPVKVDTGVLSNLVLENAAGMVR